MTTVVNRHPHSQVWYKLHLRVMVGPTVATTPKTIFAHAADVVVV